MLERREGGPFELARQPRAEKAIQDQCRRDPRGGACLEVERDSQGASSVARLAGSRTRMGGKAKWSPDLHRVGASAVERAGSHERVAAVVARPSQDEDRGRGGRR